MKALRKALFWLHLGGGVLAGLVILVLSATGVLLAFERQIVAFAERDERQVTPPASGERLPLETLLARAREARPEARITGITLRSEASASVSLALGREGVLYVDPYTAALRGDGARGVRGFFAAVTDWHRWLGAPSGEARARGRAVTGAANLVFLFMVLSGVYLWWPRAWTRTALRAITRFGGEPAGRARDFNQHNVAGFWCAVPLALIVLCGVLLSYPWANDLVVRVTGSPRPPQRAAEPQRGDRGEGSPSSEGLDRLWPVAAQQVPGWVSVSVRFPTSPEAPMSFSIDRGNGARPDRRAQLVLDRRTGEIKSFEPYETQSTARKVRAWARFVHTGEAFGPLGQAVAAVAASGAVLLVWTGLSLAWRRLRAWRARAAQFRASAAVIQTGGAP